ncbi:hypothetical protein TNCV_4971751 [Trichonephila clavipes]|nr:hypothetical protein TNCV_4971751 [Trichonephila clavipes]
MLVGLLSRWCFLIGGHGRRQWAGRTGDFGGLRKKSSQFVQADEKLVCYWSSGVDACWWAEQMAEVRKEILSSSTLGFRMPEKSDK